MKRSQSTPVLQATCIKAWPNERNSTVSNKLSPKCKEIIFEANTFRKCRNPFIYQHVFMHVDCQNMCDHATCQFLYLSDMNTYMGNIRILYCHHFNSLLIRQTAIDWAVCLMSKLEKSTLTLGHVHCIQQMPLSKHIL